MTHDRAGKIYNLGLVLIFPAVVIGELLWVIDPLRLPGGLHLIDYVHVLVAATAAIPLLWAVAAVMAVHASRARSGGTDAPSGSSSAAPASVALVCLRVVIVLASLTGAIIILTDARRLLPLGIALGTAIVGVLSDLAICEYVRRRAWPRRTAYRFLAIVLGLGVLLCPTGYLVTYPGMTMDMHRYAKVSEGVRQGSIDGVLIFERPAFPVDWLYAAVFPHYTFEKQESLGMSLGQYQQVVRVMKQDANTVAAAVALGKLGIGEGVTYHGVIVAAVLEDDPANGLLKAGDVIVGLNGEPITRVEQLLQAMEQVAPGQEAKVTVLRDGRRETLNIQTKASEDEPRRAVIGIHIADDVRFDVPLPIEYTAYMLHEGGPSHGAMLALAIIDQLTPGGVTNGFKVAGTGTIRADGSIGRIGGIRQKAFTVKRSGADVFFVPAGQEEEARKGAPDLNIVPVQTIDDILLWLQQHSK